LVQLPAWKSKLRPRVDSHVAERGALLERGNRRGLLKILIFGATGMVGQGVLRECLLAADVERIQTVGRSASGVHDPKLHEVIHHDLWNYGPIEHGLQNFDACFFCLGVSSFGMAEGEYTHITYDLTLAAARTLVRLNRQMTFVFVSAAGADSSEQGRTMWTRVKGQTENALLHLPFKAVYVLRPGLIQPLHGARSKTATYRLIYAITKPLFRLLHLVFGKSIVTTEMIGRAMLTVARRGAPKAVLEARDINAIGVAGAR
jgi:uncharacterized protein YbjT (DUF2867 family)